MQGRKKFTPKLFYQTSLENLVPENDTYRLIQKEMDFHYLYGATTKYYGSEGQERIDPVVFFKILLVGYLHTINSDNLQPEKVPKIHLQNTSNHSPKNDLWERTSLVTQKSTK
jgi:hypothetical protein